MCEPPAEEGRRRKKEGEEGRRRTRRKERTGRETRWGEGRRKKSQDARLEGGVPKVIHRKWVIVV
ncbi:MULTISPECIES: hypothetical protein [unclassified Streptomyces]|uniref:hypothetical protein n=1 Tax=unclassified Streptomyces TaxID=2593676 RepID=UPI0033DD42D1